MPGNPRQRAIEGGLAYSDVAALPVTPDLAIISTPPSTVPEIIAELAARGTKAAVVITAGIDATATDGTSLRQQMLDAARPHLMRIVGPNRSEEHTSELQSLLRISYAVFCLKKKHIINPHFTTQSNAQVI